MMFRTTPTLLPCAKSASKETSRPLALNFKWLDNAPPGGDPLRLITDGDAAPNGRFLYPYRVAR